MPKANEAYRSASVTLFNMGYWLRKMRSRYESDATTWAYASELIYGISARAGDFYYPLVAAARLLYGVK